MSAVKSRRNQSTGDEKLNRTGKLRRAQLTCMVRLLKQYVSMQYVALINSVQEMHMSQGHPTRNFDEISVRESLLALRLSDNALTKSD